MRMYAFKSISDLGVCRKMDIAEKLYDYWEQYETINKQFVLLFRDIGWIFQDLKQEGVVVSNGRQSQAARWKITSIAWGGN